MAWLDTLREKASTTARNVLAYGPLGVTHEGRVLADGLRSGTIGLVSSVIGLPRDLYEFGREHVTGQRRDRSTLPGTSDWLDAQAQRGIRSVTRSLTGSEAPEIRAGTADKYIHGAGYWGINIASLFIPVAGQARAAALGAKILRVESLGARVAGITANAGQFLGARASSVGGVLGVAGIGTAVIEGVEDVFGIGPAAAATPQDGMRQSPAPATSTDSGLVLSPNTPRPSAALAAAAAPGAPVQTDTSSPNTTLDRNVANRLMAPGFLMDPATRDFDQAKLAELQESLVASGRLTSSRGEYDLSDGIIGVDTVRAIDSAIKAEINPANMNDAQKQLLTQNMAVLLNDIQERPPSNVDFDPRVMSFQTNAYALGLYNGRIDGLAGAQTSNAAQQFGQTLTELAQQSQAQTPVPTAPAAVPVAAPG